MSLADFLPEGFLPVLIVAGLLIVGLVGYALWCLSYRSLFVAIGTGLLLLLCLAQAFAHGPYTDWLMPDGGKCCTDLKQECRQVQSWWDEERERFVIWHEGGERIVPPAALIDKPSPDGNSHACIDGAGTIFCFVNGKPKG